MNLEPIKHGHYFKPVHNLTHIDVYRVLELFEVTDPCVQHAVKKSATSKWKWPRAFQAASWWPS